MWETPTQLALIKARLSKDEKRITRVEPIWHKYIPAEMSGKLSPSQMAVFKDEISNFAETNYKHAHSLSELRFRKRLINLDRLRLRDMTMVIIFRTSNFTKDVLENDGPETDKVLFAIEPYLAFYADNLLLQPSTVV